MKKILWVSRHDPLAGQLEELRRIFGEIEVTKDANPFSPAEEIAERARGYDEVVVVVPLWVVARLVSMGVRPLWAEMELVGRIGGPGLVDIEREVVVKDRIYRFVRFRRIVAVRIDFEELE